MGQRGRRVRSLVDSQFWVVVGVLAAVAVGGGYLTYDTYADPGFHVEQRPGTSAEYAASFAHRATVQQPNPVFATGETLVGRSAYFSRLTPRLNGTFTYTYTASDGGRLATDVQLELRLRSVQERGEEARPIEYWQVTRELNATSVEALAPGEEVTVSFSRNVTKLFNETQRIDEQLGGTPGTKTVRIVAVVDAEGRVNGRDVSRTQAYRLGLSSDGSIYRVDDPGRVVNGTNTTRAVRVRNTFGPLRKGGAPLLVVLGLVGVLALAVARYRGAIALTDAERAYLTYERAREEFDDWITSARLDPDSLAGERVDVETLDGLVDIAIDSDRRVLEDPRTGTYYCRVDDLVYRYESPPEPSAGPLATLGEWGGESGARDRPDEWRADSTATGDVPTDGEATAGDEAAADESTDGDPETGGTAAENGDAAADDGLRPAVDTDEEPGDDTDDGT